MPRRPRPTRVCRTPTCEEVLAPLVRVPLCASCRLAGAGGALVAFVVFFLIELVRRLL